MTIRYISESMRSTNDTTGKTIYYQRICDKFRRITERRYDELFNDSDGITAMHTQRSHGCTRHYTTHNIYA